MLPKRIKLRHLEALVAIAQHRQIGRAAQALAISQPALSKTLSDLEDVIGMPLLLRSKSGVRLTDKGEELLGYAGSSLRTLKEGIEHVTGTINPQHAVVAAGILPTVATGIMPVAVATFQQRYGPLRPKIHTGPYSYLLAQLKRRELDMVVGRQAEPEDMPGFSFEHLYTESMVFVVRRGHPVLKKAVFELDELARYCLILPLEGTAIRRAADAFLTRHAIGPVREVMETVSYAFAEAFLSTSDAVLFAPLGTVESYLAAGLLERVKCDTSSTAASVGITVRTDTPCAPPVTNFIACIRAAALQRSTRHASEHRHLTASMD